MPRYRQPSVDHEQLSGVARAAHHAPSMAALFDVAGLNFTCPGWSIHTTTGQLLVVETLYYIPIHVERDTTFVRLGIQVTNAVAASVARLGIYDAVFDGDGQLIPDALQVDAGTVATATTGEKLITINELVIGGYHFLAMQIDGAITCQGVAAISGWAGPVTPVSTIVQGINKPVLSVVVADGALALPDPATTPTTLEDADFNTMRMRT